MTRLLHLSAFATLCLLLSGCLFNKRPEPRLTSEPSIERAFDVLGAVPDGKLLVSFLNEKPVRFEYSNTPGLCHKFFLKTGKIFLPRELKDSDKLLALALARAAYIYRLYAISGLDEIISEEEEMGALFQARIGIEINVLDKDFKRNRSAKELKSDFCIYIMEGSRSAALSARTAALSSLPECQRPLETLQAQRVWLNETRKAINAGSFYQLLYDRDLHKVHKGVMTQGEAMKNDANIRALPTYEIYRYQRVFYDKQNDIFSRIESLYNAALRDDEAWRKANQSAIDRARDEFSECNLPE